MNTSKAFCATRTGVFKNACYRFSLFISQKWSKKHSLVGNPVSGGREWALISGKSLFGGPMATRYRQDADPNINCRCPQKAAPILF
jgi:hypothetical protein